MRLNENGGDITENGNIPGDVTVPVLLNGAENKAVPNQRVMVPVVLIVPDIPVPEVGAYTPNVINPGFVVLLPIVILLLPNRKIPDVKVSVGAVALTSSIVIFPIPDISTPDVTKLLTKRLENLGAPVPPITLVNIPEPLIVCGLVLAVPPSILNARVVKGPITKVPLLIIFPPTLILAPPIVGP